MTNRPSRLRIAALAGILLGAGGIARAQSYSQQGPKLVGPGIVASGYQGAAVALSADGSTALVGGLQDRNNAGAAWVWTQSGGVWTQQGPKLVGAGAVGNNFVYQGNSVALSGDGNTALVGGPGDNSGVGAAWVWTRTGGVWTQQGAKLVGTGAAGPASQGVAVSLSSDGNTAVVGGVGDNSYAGAVWVWTRSGGVWTQQGAKLVGTGGVGAGFQGVVVSLSADSNTAIVGGYADNSYAGAAWVWTRSGGVWTQQGAKLVGSGAVGSASQATALCLSSDGNTAIVGGYEDNSGTGAAWVWTRSGGVWAQQGAKLVGSGAIDISQQGTAVSLSADGNTALVGGNGDNSYAGATWAWTRSGGVWTQQGAKLVGTGGVGETLQASAAALSADGNVALVGGPEDDSLVGASWVWTRSGSVWTQQGAKLVGTGAVSPVEQGSSVSLSADGNTALVGGDHDGAVGATWVWTRGVSAWTPQGSKLVGTGYSGTSGAGQGSSTALSADGNTAIVGGYDDGPFSDQTTGAAWVWTRSGGVWTQQGNKLVGTGPSAGAAQGFSVALSADGNTALVGGPYDNYDLGGPGAAWVWTRSGGVWSQQGAKLIGTGAAGGAALQGVSVALSADGNTALIGGSADNAGAGAAWVWTRSGGVWTQQGSKLVGFGATGSAGQGRSVALSADGNTALVSGPSDNGGVGALWAWTRSGGVWTQQGLKLVGSGAAGSSQQGHSVSITADGSTAIVGGYLDNANAGAAWVWRLSGGVWTEQSPKRVGTGAVGAALQGTSVALSGDGTTAIVGGVGDDGHLGAAWVFIAQAPSLTEFVANGTFGSGTTGWQFFATPSGSYGVHAVNQGVMEFSRVPPPPGTSNQATVFQETGRALPAGAPLLAQFDVGNTSVVRKYLKVLVIDSDFSDLAACTFWLPPNLPLTTYQMKTHPTKDWSNAAIYFYAGTANAPSDTGVYQIDNVSLQYVPAQNSFDHTDCVDPHAPIVPSGAGSTDMLTNGDFGTNALSPWTTFGTITAQATTGVLQMIRPASTPPAGVVLQAASQSILIGQIMTASFQLGNSSGVRKRVTAIMHDLDFTDLTACVFWLAPGQALSDYSMVGWTSKAWGNATMSFYAASIGPDQWTLVDNVTYQRKAFATTVGSSCLEPTGSSVVEPAPRLVVSASGGAQAAGPQGAGPAWSAIAPRFASSHELQDRSAANSSPTPDGSGVVTDGAFERAVDGTAWEVVATTTGVSTLRMADLTDLRDATSAALHLQSWLTSAASSATIRARTVSGGEWVTVAEIAVSDVWQSIDVDLTAFMGEQVELQCVFDGVAPRDLDEPDRWRVDDVRVDAEP